MSITELGDGDYLDFALFLERQCGIVLGDGRHYLVRGRLSPLVYRLAKPSLSALIRECINGADAELRDKVVDAMTTNETTWFRDTYPFTLLEKVILPGLVDKRHIKIWSAACSTGQEPYSIAMTVAEAKRKSGAPALDKVSIVGTDISQRVLAVAASGHYDGLALGRGLPDDLRDRYFTETAGGRQISPWLQRMVSFRELNLLSDFSHSGPFDIVFCRNVLIYFAPEVKKQILQQIAATIAPGGILFLGASESLSGLNAAFTLKRASVGLYYQKN